MQSDKKGLGESFEKLAFTFFQTDPKFQNIKNVWRQKDIPFDVQSLLGLPTNDIGIDLLLESVDGDFYPVQCKYHSDPNRAVGWKEASTFIGLLNSIHHFKAGYLCSNAYDVSSNYDKAHSGKPVVRLLGSIWDNVYREPATDSRPELLPLKPRPHQQKAINEAVEYFEKEGNSRGKLIFPCGAGKSLTGFWITQELSAQSVLVAVPSLALVKQTLEVYLQEIAANKKQARWLCVCSDQEIGTNEEVKMHTSDLGVPCTTDPIDIRNWLTQPRKQQQIVFTTYQSGRLVADISKQEGIAFDLAILDEAHKTVGSTGKLFSYLLFDQNIEIRKRIFMTATERFYSGTKDDIVSMDDPDVYGEVFTQMTFKEAIDQQLLTDYKVITIDVAKKEIADFIRENKLVELDSKWGTETEARSLAAMIALRKAMKALPIRNAVSFHSSIAKAERNDKLQKHITATYNLPSISSYTVSGKMSTGQRDRVVTEFASKKGALITNARCLTEGVDVPNIDCIVFADPRKSRIDIVQALGRALRRKEGKDWGYVILPIVYDGDTHEIDNDNFQEIVSIIRGLAANDERIVEYFKDKQSLSATSGRGITSERLLFLTEALEESALQDKIGIKIWEGLSRLNWMSYDEAQSLVSPLGLKRVSEFITQYDLGKIPKGIPKSPQYVYSRRGWKSWRDFLGGGRIVRKGEYWDYEMAKTYLKDKSIATSREYVRDISLDKLPRELPYRPEKYYSTSWEGWGKFLNSQVVRPTKYLSYSEAKIIIRKNAIQQKEYYNFYLERGKMMGFPQDPVIFYTKKNQWISHEDFFGVKKKYQQFLEYEKVKLQLQSLNIKTRREYYNWVRTYDLYPKPRFNPQGYHEWISWDNFFDREYWEFNKARSFVQKLNFTRVSDFKMASLPSEIPKAPDKVYKTTGWIGFSDFLGNGKTSKTSALNKLSFKDAKSIAQSLGIQTMDEYLVLYRKNLLPSGMPAYPQRFFKKEFTSIEDFLGSHFRTRFTNTGALPFEEARKEVQKLKIIGSNAAKAWSKYVSEHGTPSGVPKIPNDFYKDSGWVSWRDWLGTEPPKIERSINDFQNVQVQAKRLGLRTKVEFKQFAKANNLPTNPNVYFEEFWKGWKDFLGTS